MFSILKSLQKGFVVWAIVFLSPCVGAAGLLSPVNSDLPELVIESHKVDVVLQDGYAITSIDQVFTNSHPQDIDAKYSFPLPEDAVAAEFAYWIDDTPVIAEVMKKEDAKEVYEKEKSAGRETGLTEKNSFKTFEISVSPVRANDSVRIRFVYLQPIHIDTGMGRYVYPLEDGGVDEEALAFWSNSARVKSEFQFNLHMKSAYPVDAVRVPDYSDSAITRNAPGEWMINILRNTAAELETTPNAKSAGEAVYSLDKDIVVYWRMASGLPGSVDLIANKPDAESPGTFMLVATPGDDLGKITEGVDWNFVLDISGSMNGKYATLAEGVRQGLTKLRSSDRFRIILFNNDSNELTPGYVEASESNVKKYIARVERINPGGGTNLYAGLSEAIKDIDSDRSSGIILVTDGVANVGETEEKAFFELLKKNDIRLFTFVMGNSANRPLLDSLTKVSNGLSQSVSNADDIVGQILLATSKITHQALHSVEVTIGGVKTANISAENIGSLYRGQQLILFGQYWGSGMSEVEIRGKVSGAEKIYQTRFNFPEQATENPEIDRLWAYEKIVTLLDKQEKNSESEDIKQAVTDIALEYGLVTDYTSMIIVREEQFKEYGIERDNMKRREIEKNASEQRRTGPAVSRRVDQNSPAFSAPRASFGNGSGGSFGILSLLLLVVCKIAYSVKQRH